MAEQTYEEFLSQAGEIDSQLMIVAPCCGRNKPIFAIRPRPVQEDTEDDAGFFCDSCAVEQVRVFAPFLEALAVVISGGDWNLVRTERNNRLTLTDQFDVERIRAAINPDKLAAIDEYRTWLRNITEEYDSPKEALAAVVARAIPS